MDEIMVGNEITMDNVCEAYQQGWKQCVYFSKQLGKASSKARIGGFIAGTATGVTACSVLLLTYGIIYLFDDNVRLKSKETKED